MTTTAAPDFVAAVYIRARPESIWRAITETDALGFPTTDD